MLHLQDDYKDRLLNFKDDELRKIVYVNYNEYDDKEIIDAARIELLKRYKDDIYEDNGLTLKKLLQNISAEDIVARLMELYPKYADEIPLYKNVLEKLNLIEQEGPSDTYISVEILGYKLSEGGTACNVYGVDIYTKKKCDIKYCLWKDWMSFLIQKAQLQKIGAVDFAVYCLREMTSISFDESEINIKFNQIVEGCKEVLNKNEFLKTNSGQDIYNPEDLDSVQDETNEKNMVYSDAHPWLRYFARSIDISMFSYIFQFFWTYFKINKVLDIPIIKPAVIIEYIIWIFIEAFLLSQFGYTIGKWLLNIKVTNNRDEKLFYDQALVRAWKVFFYGEGLCIPIIGLITNIVQYDKLTRNGITSWDEDGELTVSHTEIEKYKIFLAVLILVVYPVAMAILKRYKVI